MLSPICFHNDWQTAVEPVKWIPAECGCSIQVFAVSAPPDKTVLMTPSGNPASRKTSIMIPAERICLSDGFQTTTFPIDAIEAGRFPEIAVKLNGVIANVNPSSGRYSTRFHTPSEEIGWSA